MNIETGSSGRRLHRDESIYAPSKNSGGPRSGRQSSTSSIALLPSSSPTPCKRPLPVPPDNRHRLLLIGWRQARPPAGGAPSRTIGAIFWHDPWWPEAGSLSRGKLNLNNCLNFHPRPGPGLPVQMCPGQVKVISSRSSYSDPSPRDASMFLVRGNILSSAQQIAGPSSPSLEASATRALGARVFCFT